MDRYICKEALKYVKGESGVCPSSDLKSLDLQVLSLPLATIWTPPPDPSIDEIYNAAQIPRQRIRFLICFLFHKTILPINIKKRRKAGTAKYAAWRFTPAPFMQVNVELYMYWCVFFVVEFSLKNVYNIYFDSYWNSMIFYVIAFMQLSKCYEFKFKKDSENVPHNG